MLAQKKSHVVRYQAETVRIDRYRSARSVALGTCERIVDPFNQGSLIGLVRYGPEVVRQIGVGLQCPGGETTNREGTIRNIYHPSEECFNQLIIRS